MHLSAPKLAVAGTVLVAALSAGAYVSPYAAAYYLREAIARKDAAAINDYVDFPVLRANLKEAYTGALRQKALAQNNPMAALGAQMASALVGPMVDSLVTPESLALLAQGETPDLQRTTSPRTPRTPVPTPAREEASETSAGYEGGPNQFVVRIRKRTATTEPVALVFRRQGLFAWKLTNVTLPR